MSAPDRSERRRVYLQMTGWLDVSGGHAEVWQRPGGRAHLSEAAEKEQLLSDEVRIMHALEFGSVEFQRCVAAVVGLRLLEAGNEILSRPGVDAVISKMLDEDAGIITVARNIRNWARRL